MVARGARCKVETAEGDIECGIRGALKKEKQTAVDPVAAGDWVEIVWCPDGTGTIEAIEARRTRFSRPSPGRPHLEQVIVANATQLVVIQAAREPAVKETSIDRYLVSAGVGGLRAIICVNKMDMDRGKRAGEVIDLYRSLGYDVFPTVAVTGDGVSELKTALAGETSVFAGPSGVGKSTLLNRILPGLDLRVQEVSRKWSKGKHTTSETAIFELDGGGWVVDTPGLRELGLWGVDETELGLYFCEFEAFMEDCRFSSCTHSHEPGCGVMEAVDAGRISPIRYDSYRRILESLSGSD